MNTTPEVQNSEILVLLHRDDAVADGGPRQHGGHADDLAAGEGAVPAAVRVAAVAPADEGGVTLLLLVHRLRFL